jgi:hypothetical protein
VRQVTMEQAETQLATFFEDHAGHEGVDAWPEKDIIHTWCETCKEGEAFEVLQLREAVSSLLSERRAVSFY